MKGFVQPDVRGVESRLKRSALITYPGAFVHFFNLKGNSCESSKKQVWASWHLCIELNLPVNFTISANDGLRTFNLQKLWMTSYELQATSEKFCLHQLMTVRHGTWAIVCLYGTKSYHTLIEFSCPDWSVPADDCTVQVLYRKIISQQKLDF